VNNKGGNMKGVCTIVAACLLVSGVVYALEFSDNFDDGNYYGWLEPMDLIGSTLWQIESGELHAYYEGVNFGGCQLYTPVGAVTDFDCEFISTRKTTGGAFTDGVIRISERDHHIVWQVVEDSMVVLAYNDGAGQQVLFLQNEGVGHNYHTMRLKVEGSAPTLTITAWWDGQEKWTGDITASEALAQGHVGLFASGDTASIWFDDVSLTYVSFYGVQERNAGVPSVDVIFQSKPNPFTRQVKIEYCVLTTSRVQLKIYNVLGEIVRTLVDETKCAGKYEIIWDSRNTQGKELPSGNYFYQLVTNGVASTKKLILLK